MPIDSSKPSFFNNLEVDSNRWNVMYPYRLLIVEALPSGGYNLRVSNLDKPDAIKVGEKTISFNNRSAAIFTLPITPQQMSVSTPYAISNTSTLRGIVEEHNGVKYKMVNMAGTFGVNPQRPSIPGTDASEAGGFLAGSLSSGQNLGRQVAAAVSSFGSQPFSSSNVFGAANSESPQPFDGTGYANALLLDKFLENYAEMKKDPANFNLRLALEITKQNQIFLVTPIQYTYNQSAESPNEYKFSLQFKAFRRISLDKSAAPNGDGSLGITNSLLQRIITSVAQCRRVLGASLNLIKAIRSDFQQPFNVLRQASLFYKDLAGVAASAIDLPRNIINDGKSTVLDSLKNIDSANDIFKSLKNKADYGSLIKGTDGNEGLSYDSVASNQNGELNSIALKTSNINPVFDNSDEYFDLFDAVDSSSLVLSAAQQEAVDADQELASQTTVDDLRQIRNSLIELSTQISNNFGAGSQLYSRLYNQPAPRDRIQDMTIDEYVVLKAIYDVVQAIDVSTATRDLDDERIQDAYDFVNELAEISGATFESSDAKVLVPVPFGFTIEQIALRYLGDPDRWLEIVTLNALKAPYIDEVGFKRSLLSNADGRQFNIDSNENIYIGQKVLVKSNAQPPASRKITNIEKISDTNFLITTDGLDNLDVYTIAQQAFMQAYLPGTTNSQNQFFIPSDEIPENDIRAKSVPIAAQDALTGLSKIDWLLTEDGDVAIDSLGDVRIAFGMANLIQALKMKFSISAGQLLKHPKYGNGIQVGSSTADLDLRKLYDQVRENIIADSRFQDINKLEITLDGPTLTFNVLVTVANGRGILPITFKADI